MNDLQSPMGKKASGIRKIKKGQIVIKPKIRNKQINPKRPQMASPMFNNMKAVSPQPQKFGSNYEISTKNKSKPSRGNARGFRSPTQNRTMLNIDGTPVL